MGKRRFVSESDIKDLDDSLKRSKNPLEVRKGIMDRSEHLRQIFQSEEESYIIDWMTSYSKPFPNCQIANFLASPAHSMTELEQQCVKGLELKPKKNDLFQFSQSREICTMTDVELQVLPRLNEFRTEVTKLMPYMSLISGCEITSISMFFAEYKYTDHLLTHEDDLENRVIAFVYYLNSDDWVEKDGGHYETFDSNEEGTPVSICKSWLPKRNYFNFFRVTNNSYHQVKEVCSRQKVRRSISGWFHTKEPLAPRPVMVPTTPIFTNKVFNAGPDDYDLSQWINPIYLTMESMGQIQARFEEDSEIQLTDFIIPTKYEEILQFLMTTKFEHKTPFNRKASFELAEGISTDRLKLHPQFTPDSDDEDDEDDGPTPTGGAYRSTVRKWQHNTYTLLHDADTSERASVDLFVHFLQKTSNETWDINKGGAVTYITKGEDEELLTITPKNNALSLVYRDEDTLRFVKYLNKKSAKDFFFDIFNCYYE